MGGGVQKREKCNRHIRWVVGSKQGTNAEGDLERLMVRKHTRRVGVVGVDFGLAFCQVLITA